MPNPLVQRESKLTDSLRDQVHSVDT